MFQSSTLWSWRKAMDCLVTIGILVLRWISSLLAKLTDDIPKTVSNSLIWKLFDSWMPSVLKEYLFFIFISILDTISFFWRHLRKFWHWLRPFIYSPLTIFTVLYSWVCDIYVLCWLEITQLFTLVENSKPKVISWIEKANMATMAFTSAIARIPFTLLMVTLDVIGACLKLIVSLMVLSAVNIMEFCFGVILNIIHLLCSASKKWRLNYLKKDN